GRFAKAVALDMGSPGLELSTSCWEMKFLFSQKAVAVSKVRIAILVAVSIVILRLAFAVGTAKRSPALTAQVVAVVNIDDKHFKVDALVSNRTRYVYLLLIPKLEIWNGAGWEGWADLPAAYSQNDALNAHASKATFCAYKHFQPGSRLRLVVEGDWRHGQREV